MNKRLFLLYVAFFVVSSLMAESTIVQSSTNMGEEFIYFLPNYDVTYYIKKMPPHDASAINPYAYNIIVRGPPPFPIQIEFYDQMWSGTTEKRTSIMKTDYLSTSIGCVSYPTNITMRPAGEPVSTTNETDDSQNMFKPSAPEFTIDFVDLSYNVPPTYKSEIDQYTGKNVTVMDKSGRYVENKSIVITIKNQEFPSSVNGTKYYMAYNVVVKGHYGDKWKKVTDLTGCTIEEYLSAGFPKASNSDYTVLYIPADYPADARLDVKVQAYIGQEGMVPVTTYLPSDYPFIAIPVFGSGDGIIFDTPGDWSETQTITIGENTHIGTTEIPEFPLWTVLPFVLTITLFSIIVKRKLGKAKVS